jgi:tRNA pseudouridine38-40 synthase
VLVLAYDGSAFHGFAPQPIPDLPTVGGALLEVLSRMVREPIEVSALGCAGRTDTGVHALGQVAQVDIPAAVIERWTGMAAAPAGTELPRLAKSLSSQLGPTIVVARALLAPEGFDARRSALARRYRYEILRTAAADPLERARSWHVPGDLDEKAMRMGADAVLGEHEFSGFCKRPPGLEGPLRRRITDTGFSSADTADDERVLRFEIEANAFCHHMVRAIVAALVGVGQGRLTIADLVAGLRNGSRVGHGELAPATGLRLMLVRYPDELVPGGVLSG